MTKEVVPEEAPQSPTTPFVPTIAPGQVARIKRWHEIAYQAMKSESGRGQMFDYLGLTLAVPPDVQPITGMSDLLGEAVLKEVRTDDDVLDMGTGCGVNAILAASRARSVVAVDLNPHAVAAAKENAVQNGVGERVQFRQSDVFNEVSEDFDLIVFDPPFRWFAPRDLLETAITDKNYSALTRFFAEVGSHLRVKGRLLMFFGDTGDIGYFRRLASEAGFHGEVVAHRRLLKEDQNVDYFTFRLTRST